jgi:nucleotide-binding universal stress UspA family protein
MADRALACAALLQGAAGARLDLLQIAPDVVPGTHAGSALPVGAMDVWDRATVVGPVADLGDPVASILDAIEDRRPDLVVMASESWSSAGLGDHVAYHVAGRSPVPVLVVPTGPKSVRDGHDLRRILVALDGSEQAEQALRPAQMLAQALDADMLLLRVVTPSVAAFGGRVHDDDVDLAAARRYVEACARAIETARTRVSALAVVGEPGTMIAAVGRAQRASVLAMSTRGKGDLGRPEMGGTATSSFRSAGVPLLLVPPLAPLKRGDRPSPLSSKVGGGQTHEEVKRMRSSTA